MAEQLVNEFTVNRPIDEAWAVITDVERIAPCLPGAQLQEIEGDVYRGVVKVKMGPMTPGVQGSGHDPQAGRRRSPRSCSRPKGATPVGAATRRPRSARRPRPCRPPARAASSHRPPHDRQGGPVRPLRRAARSLREPDGAVREQPQHDARRPGLRRHTCRGGACGGERRRRGVGRWRIRRRSPRAATTPPCRSSGPPVRASRGRRRAFARSTRRRPSRSTSPVSPDRRSSSGSCRSSARSSSSWCSCADVAEAVAVTEHGGSPSTDVADLPAASPHDRDRVRELLGREPAGRFDVVVRDDDGRTGGHPQPPAARRRHPDADSLLAGRPRRGHRGQPARGRRRRSCGRGGGRRRRARGRARPLRGRTRRRRAARSRSSGRPAASPAPARA